MVNPEKVTLKPASAVSKQAALIADMIIIGGVSGWSVEMLLPRVTEEIFILFFYLLLGVLPLYFFFLRGFLLPSPGYWLLGIRRVRFEEITRDSGIGYARVVYREVPAPVRTRIIVGILLLVLIVSLLKSLPFPV